MSKVVRSGLRCAVLAVGLIAGIAPAAVAAPPTLTGETLSSLDPAVAGTCDPSGTSAISFGATGFPVGPYEATWPDESGSFTETGTATVGPQPAYTGGGSFPHGDLTAFSATFSIQTPDASITGVKTADASSLGTGACREVTGDPDVGNARYVAADVNGLTYEARIVTAEGTFLDRGTTYVHVDRFTTDVGNPFASFSETFESSLGETIRVPGSAQECKDDGYQAFPELAFKSQGECVAYVHRSGS
jgi:hypothetical protein